VAQTLAEMVQNKLNAGTLPREDAVKLWAGMGSGKTCALCEQPIDSSQAEYEIEYDVRPAIRLHADCHAALEVERKRPTVTATASLSDVSGTTISGSSDRDRPREQRSKRRRGPRK
jgi:hypothetical protein